MKASTILKKARKLIKETGHTKGELARNKYRHKVDPTSPSAVRFCAYGALHQVMGINDFNAWNPNRHLIEDVSKYLMDTIPNGTWWSSIDVYNDKETTTPEDVDKWYTRAIKLAKSTGN